MNSPRKFHREIRRLKVMKYLSGRHFEHIFNSNLKEKNTGNDKVQY